MPKPKPNTPRPTWAQPGYNPQEKLIPEGSEEGGATVRYDPEKGQNFHLNLLKQRVYHEAPAAAPALAETLAAEASWRDPEAPTP
ncbi:MAG: hypothetical protein ACO1SX_00180 [Actinomycetota bacterium]